VKRYVLDSFALIVFLEYEPGADKVAGILRDINEKKARGFMSVINWGEIYYNTMREAGIEEAEKVMEHLSKHSIQLIDADRDLTYRAAKLKAIYRIAYADCFAAALSSKLKATVVTGNPEFEKLSHEITIYWVA
jgi:predicted nucleic acid-binding protein